MPKFPPYLIGLSGKRQAGKDTLAAALVADHGFVRVALADALKDFLYFQNPLVMNDDGQLLELAEMVDLDGWDSAKQHAEVRRLLQRAGQGMVALDPDTWCRIAFNRVDAAHAAGHPVVVTDMRLAPELPWLRARYGTLVRVNRTGHIIADQDRSETEADSWDYDVTVWNDGPGLTDPRNLAHNLMLWLAG